MKLNTKSLANVDRGFPVLAEQVLFAQLTAEVKQKKTGDGQNLEIDCRILDPEVMKKDGTFMDNSKGKMMFKYFVSLTATERYDPDKTLAMIADAVKLPRDADLELEDINGAYVKVKLGVRPANDRSDESNVIKSLLPIRDEDNFTPPEV